MGTQARDSRLPSLHRPLRPSVKGCAIYGERPPESGSLEAERACENVALGAAVLTFCAGHEDVGHSASRVRRQVTSATG